MAESLQEYIEGHISPEPPELQALRRRVNLELLYPHMCSGHLQGRLLAMLVRMAGARRVLEIGTYAGYSALCLAEGLPADDPQARVDTIEIDDEMETFIRQALASSPYGHRVHLHIGDALKVAPSLPDAPYDLIYMDANKRQYVDHYQMALRLLRPGGWLLADNTLWDGKVADPAAHDAQTEGIRAFNTLVAHDTRITPVILPLRDGLTIIMHNA